MPAGSLLFVLNLETQGLKVDVRVNDITVYSNTGRQATFADKLNPVVVSGANLLTVSMAQSQMADPSDKKPLPAREPAFRLTVQRGQIGNDPGDSGIILQYRWDGKVPLSLASSEVFRAPFNVGTLPWRPLWTSFIPLQTSDKEVENFAFQLADSLRRRNVERVVYLHVPKFRELANSLDLSEVQTTEAFRSYLQRLTSAQNWSVDPVDATRLRWRSEANDRIVRVTLNTGEPPIMAHSAGSQVPFFLNLSRLNGELRIVR